MEQKFFEFILQIPKTIANLCEFLLTPIHSQYLNISPLGLFSAVGTTLLITIIGVHVVRLFTI